MSKAIAIRHGLSLLPPAKQDMIIPVLDANASAIQLRTSTVALDLRNTRLSKTHHLRSAAACEGMRVAVHLLLLRLASAPLLTFSGRIWRKRRKR
jgi:hypothetical protein